MTETNARDIIRRRFRVVSAWTAIFALVGLTCLFWFAMNDRTAEAIATAVLIVVVATVYQRNLRVCCPFCDRVLRFPPGTRPLRDFADLKFCPHCGASFDKPVKPSKGET